MPSLRLTDWAHFSPPASRQGFGDLMHCIIWMVEGWECLMAAHIIQTPSTSVSIFLLQLCTVPLQTVTGGWTWSVSGRINHVGCSHGGRLAVDGAWKETLLSCESKWSWPLSATASQYSVSCLLSRLVSLTTVFFLASRPPGDLQIPLSLPLFLQ